MPAPAWECACGAANDATSPVCFACGRASVATAPSPAITWGTPADLAPADQRAGEGNGGVLTATGGRRAPGIPPPRPAPPANPLQDGAVGRDQAGTAAPPANGHRSRGPVLPVRRATGRGDAPETPAHWPIPTFEPADPETQAPPPPTGGRAPASPPAAGTPGNGSDVGRAGPPAGATPRPATRARRVPADPSAAPPEPPAGHAGPSWTPLSDEDWRARLGLDEDDLAGADWAPGATRQAAPAAAEPAADDDWRARLGIDRENVFDHPAPGPGGVVPPVVAYRPPPVHDRRSSAAEPPPPLLPVAADRRSTVALSLAGLFDGGADHDPGAVPASESPVKRRPLTTYSFDMESEHVTAPPRRRRLAIASPGGVIALIALIGAIYIVATFALHSSPAKAPGPAPVTPATPAVSAHP